MQMLIVTRVLSSACVGAGEFFAAGAISDMREIKIKWQCNGDFHLGPMLGVAGGSINGGALVQRGNWPAFQWISTTYATALCIALISCLHETLQARAFATNAAEKDLHPRAMRRSK
ncbi:hypothetical protein N7G274_001061 [Stereocaulon virgatum]|uniref:Uncharacterized protein n=1 Tax=Stereocaulon virgatum TaxID=373712 RepID=A0ABR4APJ7_9LECA